MKRAIIVLGHGSRSAEAGKQFLHIVSMLQKRFPESSVFAAYMELADPRLQQAIAQAVADGAVDILVVPCFLFQGIHIKEDIPEMLSALRQQHPEVMVRFGRPIGADPRVADILAERVEEMR